MSTQKSIKNSRLLPSQVGENGTSIVKFARVFFSSTRETKVVPINDIKVIQGKQTFDYVPVDLNDFVQIYLRCPRDGWQSKDCVNYSTWRYVNCVTEIFTI